MPSHRVATLLSALLMIGVAAAGCLGGGDDGNGGGNDGGDGNNGNGGGGDGKDPSGRDPGKIGGTVTAPDGDISGASVQLSRIFESTETDSQGRFSFDEVPPGDYRLTVTQQHYETARLEITVEEGQEQTVDVELELRLMPGTDVPAKYALSKNYVSVMGLPGMGGDLDVLLASAGTPLGGPEATVTNMTKNNTFPGFWDLPPEEDYLFVRFDVSLFRLDTVDIAGHVLEDQIPELPELPELPEDPPETYLGLRYFRGNDLTDNELIDPGITEYHKPEPLIQQDLDILYLWYYQFANEDWSQWGDMNWQIGVVAENTTDLPLGAGIPHWIQINALLVHQDYAELVAE